MIELNPFDDFTGSGLFSWQGTKVYDGPYKLVIIEEPLVRGGGVYVTAKVQKSLERIKQKQNKRLVDL